MDEKYPTMATSPYAQKLRLISRLSSSNGTFLSAQMFLLRLSFSYVSWCFSFKNLSLSKEEIEEEAFLLALVFLDIVLRKGQDTQKITKKKQRKKPRADCKLAKKYRNNNSI